MPRITSLGARATSPAHADRRHRGRRGVAVPGHPPTGNKNNYMELYHNEIGRVGMKNVFDFLSSRTSMTTSTTRGFRWTLQPRAAVTARAWRTRPEIVREVPCSISIDKRLAFLAMPKTGTTALHKALVPHCEIRFGRAPRPKHMSMRFFEEFMLPYLREIGAGDTETVCVILEPVDWLGSWYRYLTQFRPKAKSTKCDQLLDLRRGLPREAAAGVRQGRPADALRRRPLRQAGGHPHVPLREHSWDGGLPREGFGKTIRLPEANVSP